MTRKVRAGDKKQKMATMTKIMMTINVGAGDNQDKRRQQCNAKVDDDKKHKSR